MGGLERGVSGKARPWVRSARFHFQKKGGVAMKAWRITQWRLYERADLRKTASMPWYAKQTKLIGQGIGKTLREPFPRNMTLLGTWNMIETLACLSAQEHRGWLVRNGQALDSEGMADLIAGVPPSGFEEAVSWFSQEKINWLEQVEFSPGNLPPFSGHHANNGTTPGKSPGTLPAISQCHPSDSPSSSHPRAASRKSLAVLPGTDRQTDRQTDNRGGGAASIEIPSDDLVFKTAQAFPGEPASGAPAMPRAWVELWLARMNGRERWPADWARKLVADWRVEFRTWGKTKKNATAAPNGAHRERWQIEKDLETVRVQLREHPKVGWPANKPMPQKIAGEFDALVQRRGELEKELKT
jgi:hypothetical protein